MLVLHPLIPFPPMPYLRMPFPLALYRLGLGIVVHEPGLRSSEHDSAAAVDEDKRNLSGIVEPGVSKPPVDLKVFLREGPADPIDDYTAVLAPSLDRKSGCWLRSAATRSRTGRWATDDSASLDDVIFLLLEGDVCA